MDYQAVIDYVQELDNKINLNDFKKDIKKALEKEEIELATKFLKVFRTLNFFTETMIEISVERKREKLGISRQSTDFRFRVEKFEFSYGSGLDYFYDEAQGIFSIRKAFDVLRCLILDYSFEDEEEIISCYLPIETHEQFKKAKDIVKDLRLNQIKLYKLFSKKELELMQNFFQDY